MKIAKIIPLLAFSHLLFIGSASAQVFVESFDDGDFTSNPAWSGDTNNWEIVADSDVAADATGSNTLRLNVGSGGGTQYLSLQRTDTWGTGQTWGFWMGRRDKPAQTSDQMYVWLWASEANLESSTIDGYRIRFGDNTGDDDIVLELVENGSHSTVMSSSSDVPNGITDYGFLVRVTRNSSSEWSLFTSVLPTTSGSGAIATDVPSKANTTVPQFSVTDATFTHTGFSNGYFGFMVDHSSDPEARAAAEFDQFYFAPEDDHPLPVELLTFTASYEHGTVVLKWATASETENLGFHVWRAQASDSDYERITSAMIPGAGNSAETRQYAFVDRNVKNGKTYRYQLADVDLTGYQELHGPIVVTTSVPGDYALLQNHPNPLKTTTSIQFRMPVSGFVKLAVYNSLGQEIRRLADGNYEAGAYSLLWNGVDDSGEQVANGLYFYRLQVNRFATVRKLIVVH